MPVQVPAALAVKCEYFRATIFTSWDSVFEQAAAFATKIGRERLITISQSGAGGTEAVVAVWYWDEVRTADSHSTVREAPIGRM